MTGKEDMHKDTIAAIATPPGAGGISIVRVSGVQALDVLAGVFKPRRPVTLAAWPTHTARIGMVVDPLSGENLDEALALVMRGPRSYTGEDVVELQCHGGAATMRAVLDACLQSGARLAAPGEFTKRAFLNGRMDLAQAEAVLDIITARTEAARRVGEHQLKGELSVELAAVREALLAAYAALEAEINFPDDVEAEAEPLWRVRMSEASVRIGALLMSSRKGLALKEGVRVAIVGRPNVGKSSLLNAFLKLPRAIVTDVAGTTRDVLEETVDLGGVPVCLMDTAGILAPRDKVEEEAVRRSRAAMQEASIVLLVIDASAPLDAIDEELLRTTKDERRIVVLNKTDLVPGFDLSRLEGACRVSALRPGGINDLEGLLLQRVLAGHAIDGHGTLVNNVRHVEALRAAQAGLDRGIEATDTGGAVECAGEALQSAIKALDAITGRHIDEDLLEQIFSRFCIGK
jgi:tRNA modification GTPase